MRISSVQPSFCTLHCKITSGMLTICCGEADKLSRPGGCFSPPCSCPTGIECWEGAPKTRSTPCHRIQCPGRRYRHRYRQELVPRPRRRGAWRHSASARVVAWPRGGAAGQYADLPDWHGSLRRCPSPGEIWSSLALSQGATRRVGRAAEKPGEVFDDANTPGLSCLRSGAAATPSWPLPSWDAPFLMKVVIFTFAALVNPANPIRGPSGSGQPAGLQINSHFPAATKRK